MKKILFLNLVILVILLLSFLNCDDSGNADDIVFPSSGVSFTEHVQPLFTYKCTMSGCHEADPQNTRLSLVSYYETTRYAGIVVGGYPDNSVLVQRLNGRLVPRMPLYMDTLSSNHYNGIRTWIKEGALNN
jgi:hypothetical protein